MVYDKFDCAYCGAEELAFRTGHLASGEALCCNCYYAATKNGSEPFVTMEEFKAREANEADRDKERNKYINLFRKYAKILDKQYSYKDALRLEVTTSETLFNKPRHQLGVFEETTLYKHLCLVGVSDYYGERLPVDVVRSTYLDYYQCDEYLSALKKGIATSKW